MNQKSEGSSLRSGSPSPGTSPAPEPPAAPGAATPSRPSRGEKVLSSPHCATLPEPELLDPGERRGSIPEVFTPGREENFPFTFVSANLDLHGALGIAYSASYEASSQKFMWAFEGRKGRERTQREAFGFCLCVFGPKHHLFPVLNQPSSAFAANIPLPLYCRCHWAPWHLG